MNTVELPAYLTIDEAAHELTDRTGSIWTPRSILGYAVRHEISVHATINRDVRLVRAKPIEGEQNELLGPAGFVARLSADAVRSYLLTGIARFDGIEGTETAEIFGPPALYWTMQWVFPEGEEAPEVRADSFRVSDAGLLQLIESYTSSQPATSGMTEKAAPAADKQGDAVPEVIRKRAVLIAELSGMWPSIESDLHEGADNGLSAVAKSNKHGMWKVRESLNWAAEQGKIEKNRAEAFVRADGESEISALVRAMLERK